MVIRCPSDSCRAEVTLNYADVLQREAMVCTQCGRTIRFSPETVTEFRRALHQYRALKDRLEEAQKALIAAASVEAKPGA